MGHRRAARQSGDGAARVRLPVGGAQAGKGRHQHHASAVGHAFGQLLHLAAVLDGLQAVAQPLHHGTADEDAAFQRKLGLAARLGGRCGQQAVARGLEAGARVHEHEATRAVGVLGHACIKTGLAEQCALLVAGHAADVDGAAQHLVSRLAEIGGRRQHLGHQTRGNVQQGQQIGIPLVAVHIEEHGAAGVAHIGDMALAARQLPDQPAIHRAEGQLAGLRCGACAGHVVQQPLELGA